MKALQQNSIFSSWNDNVSNSPILNCKYFSFYNPFCNQIDEKIRLHRERIDKARPHVDCSEPVSMHRLELAAKSPCKRLFKKLGGCLLH